MRTIDPTQLPTKEMYQFLVGAVAPRPIAFVSTIDQEGRTNLAPYSFFNVFSSNPPIAIFAPSRRVKDNETKDTLHNAQATGEVVINLVNYAISRQMAITSIQYPADVSEFDKSGLTPIPSELVKPPRVKESPVQMECKVREIISMGSEGGSGQLIICEILRMHIDEAIIDDRNRIDPHKADLMGRLGRAYYVRASGEAVHVIYQAQDKLGIGFDRLPQSAQFSPVLTGNNLGQLSGVVDLPTQKEVEALRSDSDIQILLQEPDTTVALHRYAQQLLAQEAVQKAAAVVWLAESLVHQEMT